MYVSYLPSIANVLCPFLLPSFLPHSLSLLFSLFLLFLLPPPFLSVLPPSLPQVVMSVVQLYYHLAPQSEQGVVTKAFIRLLKGHRSVGVGGAGVGGAGTGRWVHLFGGHEHMLVGYKGDHDLVVDCEGAIFLLQYETTSVGDWVEPGFDTDYPPLLSPRLALLSLHHPPPPP